MADIDRLEIEISAESSDAAKKVNMLAQALERLKSAVAGSSLSSVSKSIRAIGNGAEEAKSELDKKQKVINGVKPRVKNKNTASKAVEKAQSQSESRSSIQSDSEIAQVVERAVARMKEMQNAAEDINATKIAPQSDFSSLDQMNERLARTRKAIDEIKKSHEVGSYEPLINESVNASGLKKMSSQAEKLSAALEEAKGKLADLQGFTEASLKLHPSLDKAELTEIAQLENAVQGLSDTYEELTQRIAEFGDSQQESLSKKVKKTQQAAGEVPETKGSAENDFLNSLSQALSGTKLGGKIGDITALAGEISKVSSAASQAGAATSALGASATSAGAAGASAMTGMSAAMAGASAAIGPLLIIFEAIQQKFNENKEFLQSDRSLWTDIDAAWEGAGEAATNFAAALMLVHPELKAVVYAMRSFIQPGQELLGVLGSLAETGFKKAGAALQDFASSGFDRAGSAVKAFAGNVGDGLKSIGPRIGQLLIKPFTSAIATINKWQASLGRMIAYRAINAAMRMVSEGIREGIDNLYQFSSLAGGRFASSMDSLASSSLYLKNSLGSMAAPLINALAPAIEFIISRLVALINIIGTVFAVITGQGSFVQAKKNAVSFGDAVGGAAGAAKELQDYMLGIDELNVIKDSSGGGGGGGGGGGLDFSDMFEEVPLPDWAKEMQEAIENGDWYHAGEILAEHLNGIINDWNSFEWGKQLGEKITNGLDFALGFLRKFNWDQFGEKIGEAINGIGKGINFTTLGQVIGAGWNAVFKTANGIFTTIDWKMWGRNIAAAINGFVGEVEWDTIGETFSNGVLGLLTMFDEAIRGINWYNLGASLAEMLNAVKWEDIITLAFTAIQNAIKGAAEALRGFCENFRWDEVANAIVNGINNGLSYLSESEWREIGSAIGEVFTKGFEFVKTILEGIDWPQLGRDIVALLNGVNWVSLLEAAGGAIAAGFNGIIDSLWEIVSDREFWNKLGEGVKTGVREFFNNFKIGKAVDGLSKVITNGINLAIEAIKGLVEAETFWRQLGEGVKSGISNFFENVSPQEMSDAFFGLLQRVIDVAIVAISELAAHADWWAELGTAIGNGINGLIEDTDWEELFTSLVKLATGILKGLTNALKTIDWDAAWQTIKEAIDAVDWGPLVEAAMGFFAEAFKAKMKIKLFEGDMFLTIGGNVGKALLNGVLEGLESIPILGWFVLIGESIITIMKDVGALIFAVFTGKWNEIPGLLKTATDDMQNITAKWGEKMKGTAEDAMSGVETSINTHTGAGRDDVRRMTEEMRQIAAEKLQQIKDDAETKMQNIAGLVKSGWETSKTVTAEIVENTAGIASDLFEGMRLTVETKTGSIKEISGKNWGDTQSDTKTNLESMAASTDSNYSSIKKSVSDNLANSEVESKTKWLAIEAVTKAQQIAMNTSTIAQYAAMRRNITTSLEETNSTTTTKWGEIVKTTTNKAGEVLTAVKSNFDKVSGEVVSGLNSAKSAAAGISFYSVGTNIIDGVSAGVREKAQALATTVSNSILNAAQAARRAAQINSPSRLFRDAVGVYIGQGVAAGVDKSQRDIISSIQNVNASMEDAFAYAVTDVWGGMEADVGSIVARMADRLANYMRTARQFVSAEWENIAASARDGAMKMLSAVDQGFGDISNIVLARMNQARSAVASMEWTSVGRDIARGMAQGVNQASGYFAQAVADTAVKGLTVARQVLGIHSPSSVARDMIGVNVGLGIAEGVDRTAGTVVSALERVNDLMLSAFDLSRLAPPQDMSFPIHEDLSRRYAVEYEYDTAHESDTAERFAESVREGNGQVVDTLYAIAVQLIEAIHTASERQPSLYLDGKQLMQNNEKHKLQRGANILGGGGVMA